MRRPATIAKMAVLGLICLAFAACSDDYLSRRDTLSAGSGDAIRADIAKQVIDPWPPNSRLDMLEADGQRTQHAMELYRNPSSGIPASAVAPSSFASPVAK